MVTRRARGEMCVTECEGEIVAKERWFVSARIESVLERGLRSRGVRAATGESVLERRLWSLGVRAANGETERRDGDRSSMRDEGTVDGVESRGDDRAGPPGKGSLFDKGVRVPNGMNTLGDSSTREACPLVALLRRRRFASDNPVSIEVTLRGAEIVSISTWLVARERLEEAAGTSPSSPKETGLVRWRLLIRRCSSQFSMNISSLGAI